MASHAPPGVTTPRDEVAEHVRTALERVEEARGVLASRASAGGCETSVAEALGMDKVESRLAAAGVWLEWALRGVDGDPGS